MVKEADAVRKKLQKGVFIDLETTLRGEIREAAFRFGEEKEVASLAPEKGALLRRLDALAREAEFVGGHNILWHDLPILADSGLCPELLRLPVVDTLLLSPLAFPQKPYHRLIKNDKMVTASRSSPLNDIEASLQVAEDSLRALGEPEAAWPMLATFLGAGSLPDRMKAGLAVISGMIGSPRMSKEEALEQFGERFRGRHCEAGLRRLLENPGQAGRWTALAFAGAWIRVAGTDSIIPPWVRRQFPEVIQVVQDLRSTPCHDPACSYCAETHDAVRQLKKYFGFGGFRPEPALSSDPTRSLQEEIVRLAMAGRPLLAILPTGGGKSLCFQLPALQRYYRDGALTVVLSPLQALMKDQVDGLATKTGLRCVGALHGLLTPPERGELLEEIKMGGIGILYVAPEQLRNPSFRQAIGGREIGFWVCDEAHCISKWGHDFRPDYLYFPRFVRDLTENQQVGRAAPVLCLTATAKEDVREEIRHLFREHLDQDLLLLDGGAERCNLDYQVEPVDAARKAVRIHEILTERLPETEGSAVVFFSRRRSAEQSALILSNLQWSAAHFHAGLDPEEKKGTLDRFMSGEIRVICATNAFGMGIDKEDIRIVIHADVPGSLENYLQEAGRAGRDRKPAECILLFSQADLENQFDSAARSRIPASDIRKILSALRNAELRIGRGSQVNLSAREILRWCQGGTTMEDDHESTVDTKVKSVISLLEEGRFLERQDNQTRVFQGRALVEDLAQAEVKIARMNLPPRTALLWRQFMEVFLSIEESTFNALDRFTEVPAMAPFHAEEKKRCGRLWNRYRAVLDTLNQMAAAGLIKKDLLLSAIVYGGSGSSSDLRRRKWALLERRMLDLLREADPDPEGQVPLNLRKLNTVLSRELGEPTLVSRIPTILELWRRDRPRLEGGASAFLYRKHGPGYLVSLPEGWDPVVRCSELRQQAGSIILGFLVKLARERFGKKRAEVEFSESELLQVLREDLVFAGETGLTLARVIRFVLVSLSDQEVIVLKNGKALFTQSMRIQLMRDAQGRYSRRFGEADYKRLEVFYKERDFQIHVMAEYARLALDSLRTHLRLIRDYFQLSHEAFAQRYFSGRTRELEMATGKESYRRIVESLGNREQGAIVCAPLASNSLILAGPGSGKTRVVAHRCAYLIRVCRVRPRSVLVVCFNRHACLTLRQRIQQLLGDSAAMVTIQTYHGLALSVLGKSLAPENHRLPAEAIDFDALVEEATETLKAPDDSAGPEAEDTLRSRLLRGYQHILVDEYQDVSQREYDFLSQIAGRTLKDGDQKLSILAVGDDDQSIYGFRQANTRFIQQFQADYQAEIHYLVQNYRSTAHIINTANRLISLNRERMKTAHEIRVNDGRRSHPAGGRLGTLDRFAQGRVQIVSNREPGCEGVCAIAEMLRLRELDPTAGWEHFAIISRNRSSLNPMRALLESRGIPVDWRAGTDALPSPFRVREIHAWMRILQEAAPENWTSDQLMGKLNQHSIQHGNPPWCELLFLIAEEWKSVSGNLAFPVSFLRDFFAEALHEYRQERRNPQGVILAHAHRVKGLEFPHVFILSPGWGTQHGSDALEEERRLYYVAMTRAQLSLTLFESPHLQSWLDPLTGDSVLRRTWAPSPSQRRESLAAADLRYGIIGLDEVFLAYAGFEGPDSSMHRALRALRTGTSLSFSRWKNAIILRTGDGAAVARLSAKGRALWEPRLERIQRLETKAIVTRFRDEEKLADPASILSDTWEIPIAEAVWRESEPSGVPAGRDPGGYLARG